jgi:hypothetical protein
MATDRISICINPRLRRGLQEQASLNGKKESDVVREALESYLVDRGGSVTCFDLALEAGLIGAARNEPRNLSTQRKHFRGLVLTSPLSTDRRAALCASRRIWPMAAIRHCERREPRSLQREFALANCRHAVRRPGTEKILDAAGWRRAQLCALACCIRGGHADPQTAFCARAAATPDPAAPIAAPSFLRLIGSRDISLV